MRLWMALVAGLLVGMPASSTQGGNCLTPPGAHAAAFSPDGAIVATILPEGTCRRWDVAISYRGDTVRWLGSRARDDSAASLSWSPGSRYLVVGRISTRNAVVLYDSQSPPGQYGRTIAHGVDPAWSPDGRSIAYTDRRDGVHVVAPDGSGDRQIAPGDRPAWSPDSSHLAYHREGSIYVARSDGSDERRLAAGEGASWSPDRHIGVLRQGAAYLVRPDGSDERRLGPGRPIQWSSTGDEVALLDDAGVLRVVSVFTGHARRVAEDVAAAAILPGGDAVVTVLRVGRRSEVYRATSSGAHPVRRTASQCNLYTAHCVDGMDDADRIDGTARRDVIFPGGGDDRIRSHGGDDRVDASYGRDSVEAGAGNDVVFAHGNDDRIEGGPGRDHLYPGNGEDQVNGGRGRDSIVVSGDARVDRVRCGPGRDFVIADPVDRVARDCETVRIA